MKWRKPGCRMLLCTLFGAIAAASYAQLKTAAVFADHMVLQRRMLVPVWGTAKAGETVAVSYNNQTASTTVDDKGNWKAYLQPMEAQGVGKDLVITAGTNSLTFHDVLVGEVWLCSGQSNMRMEMMFRDNAIPGVVDWENEVKKADYPAIRFYNRFREKGSTPWEVCDTASVKTFSAVAYYFGTALFKDQQVPVGLIHQSAGGTSIQKWIPQDYFRQLPWSKQYLDYSQYPPWLEPASCYDNFIAPLVGYGIRGVLWYQGESNANFDVHGYSYRYLLPLLIQSWRKEWKRDDLPFAFVQLPLFDNSDAFRYIREAQLQTLKTVPHTGLITTYDKDEFRSMLHPRNKKHIGERLAIWALAHVYGKKELQGMGPVYQSSQKAGSAIRITFDEELSSVDGKELAGFMIASADKNFKVAKAIIANKNDVIVSEASTTDPVAVRYTWGENIAPGTLTNKQGLPASAFRTDTWGNDTLEEALVKGKELQKTGFTGKWFADAKAMNTWLPATQPAKADMKNDNKTITLSTNRNGRGGIQSPYLLQVDFSKKPLVKLTNLQLGSAQGWTLMIMTPEKDQYMVADQSVQTGDITIDLAGAIRQNKQKSGNSLKLGGKNDIVLLLYATGDQRRSTLSLDGIALEYAPSN